MTDYQEKFIGLLTEIRDGIKLLVAQQGSGGAPAAGAVASDADLDGKYGNPEVRTRVKDWSGPPMTGRKFSQCPAEFLDLLADVLDWKAGKEASDPEKAKYAPLTRKDAARARGWAARIRAGKVTPPATEAATDDDGWGQDSGVGAW